MLPPRRLKRCQLSKEHPLDKKEQTEAVLPNEIKKPHQTLASSPMRAQEQGTDSIHAARHPSIARRKSKPVKAINAWSLPDPNRNAKVDILGCVGMLWGNRRSLLLFSSREGRYLKMMLRCCFLRKESNSNRELGAIDVKHGKQGKRRRSTNHQHNGPRTQPKRTHFAHSTQFVHCIFRWHVVVH
eukprot:IDg8065t1